jgi:uncharacterized protein YdaU (DUF1376 family)
MAKAPAFQLYSNDFFVDTITWELDELGLYSRLLFVEWSNGPLPNDHKKLAKIAGISPKKFSNLFQIVSSKFVLNDDGNLVNVRMEKAREKQVKYAESRKEIAHKRWEKDDAHGMHMHEHKDMHTGCSSSSSSLEDINTLVRSPASDPEKDIIIGAENNGCPHQKIISLYHEILTILPQVRVWTPKRQKMLKARWLSSKEYQDLDWWKQFFEFVRDECPHLTGKNDRQWTADLEWLCKEENFVKTVEGRYHKK